MVVGVDQLVAGAAHDKRLAPFGRHDPLPAEPIRVDRRHAGDLVDFHGNPISPAVLAALGGDSGR